MSISKIFSISLIKAILYSNILFTVLISIVSYLLGIVFLKNRTLALTLATYNISILTLYYHYHAIRNITNIFFVLMLFFLIKKKYPLYRDIFLNLTKLRRWGVVQCLLCSFSHSCFDISGGISRWGLGGSPIVLISSFG